MDRPKYRAYMCCGPNCGPKGSAQLLDALAGEVERHHLSEQVSVSASTCQSHCESGPTMVVYPGPVFYQEMSAERLVRIVTEHFQNGVPVADYFWNGVRRKIIPGQRPILSKGVQFDSKQVPERPAAPPARKETPRHVYEDVDDFKW